MYKTSKHHQLNRMAMKRIFGTVLLAVSFLLVADATIAQPPHAGRHYKKHKSDKYYKHYNKRNYGKGHNGRYVPWANAHRYRYQHHAYFPDHRVFYDARRGGYVYMSRNRWVFSRSLPSSMRHINLSRARMQLLTGVPLTAAPQHYYRSSYSRYSYRR